MHTLAASRTAIRALVLISVGCFVTHGGVSAQEPWRWPEQGKNLQVLPKDFPPERLRAVMLGFSDALGVRCSHCHVGEEGKPLSTFDFASDANPKKATARRMYEMLGMINDQLEKVQPSGPARVNMWCHTCHHGQPRPLTLDEALTETYTTRGLEAMVARYRELRASAYGRGAFDFGEATLNDLGYSFLAKGDTAAAIAVFAENTGQFPNSTNTHDSLGEAYLKAGQKALAIAAYERSLALDPDNTNTKAKLEELQREAAP